MYMNVYECTCICCLRFYLGVSLPAKMLRLFFEDNEDFFMGNVEDIFFRNVEECHGIYGFQNQRFELN
jgi:hypothetical protein